MLEQQEEVGTCAHCRERAMVRLCSRGSAYVMLCAFCAAAYRHEGQCNRDGCRTHSHGR